MKASITPQHDATRQGARCLFFSAYATPSPASLLSSGTGTTCFFVSHGSRAAGGEERGRKKEAAAICAFCSYQLSLSRSTRETYTFSPSKTCRRRPLRRRTYTERVKKLTTDGKTRGGGAESGERRAGWMLSLIEKTKKENKKPSRFIFRWAPKYSSSSCSRLANFCQHTMHTPHTKHKRLPVVQPCLLKV